LRCVVAGVLTVFPRTHWAPKVKPRVSRKARLGQRAVQAREQGTDCRNRHGNARRCPAYRRPRGSQLNDCADEERCAWAEGWPISGVNHNHGGPDGRHRKRPTKTSRRPRRRKKSALASKLPWEHRGRFSTPRAIRSPCMPLPALYLAYARCSSASGRRAIHRALHFIGRWTIWFLLITLAYPAGGGFDRPKLIQYISSPLNFHGAWGGICCPGM